MDDTGSRSPEADIVLCTRGSQEFVDLFLERIESVLDLLVYTNGSFKILWSTLLRLDQVITVNSCRNGDLRQSRTHELQNDHLCGGILTSNPIRPQIEIRLSTNNFLFMGIVQVTVQDFFRIRQGSFETLFDDIDVVGEFSTT